MKKYVWFLIAAAFAVAIFAMVGCKPAETPATSPSPAVTPATDTKCPQIKSIVVKNVYGDAYRVLWGANAGDATYGNFTITIDFDEDIAGNWSCLKNKDNWTVTVVNSTRQDADGELNATVTGVTKVDSNTIKITAQVWERLRETTVNNVAYDYYGLVCDEEDATFYGEKGLGDKDAAPTVADTVKIKLDNDCIVYDALGNACCGSEEIEACCSIACEVTIPTGCPLTLE